MQHKIRFKIKLRNSNLGLSGEIKHSHLCLLELLSILESWINSNLL